MQYSKCRNCYKQVLRDREQKHTLQLVSFKAHFLCQSQKRIISRFNGGLRISYDGCLLSDANLALMTLDTLCGQTNCLTKWLRRIWSGSTLKWLGCDRLSLDVLTSY